LQPAELAKKNGGRRRKVIISAANNGIQGRLRTAGSAGSGNKKKSEVKRIAQNRGRKIIEKTIM